MAPTPSPTAAPDGWTELTGFPTYGRRTEISAISYGEGTFVAVGWSIRNGNTRGRVWTSTDGRAWVAQPDAAFAGLTLEAVTHNGTDFYAFASAPTTVWRSGDGTSWLEVDLPEDGGELGSFNAFTGGHVTEAFSVGGTMYAAGETTVYGGDIACSCVAVWRSDNGVDWSPSIVVEDDVFKTFAVKPGLGVVVGYGTYIGQAVWSSTDFDSWTTPDIDLPGGSGFLDATSDGQRIVAVGYTGDEFDDYNRALALVTDGSSWTTGQMDAAASGPAEQLTWAGGRFVAVGDVTWWSVDGASWQRGPSVPYPPPDPLGPEPGDDPFARRTIGGGAPGVVLAQTYDEGLHVWFAPVTAFD